MAERFSGLVTDVQPLKSGTREDGKRWTLYGVWVLAEGQREPKKFTTFDAAFLQQVGHRVTFEYETVEKDRFVDFRIVAPQKSQRGDGLGPVLERLEAIEAKLDAVINYIRSNYIRSRSGPADKSSTG